MTVQKTRKDGGGRRRVISFVLLALAAVLLVVAIFGFIIRGQGSTKEKLSDMRRSAVVHAASGGLVDSIAQTAKADKLKELRARPDFRKIGENERNQLMDEAEAAARTEAEALYGTVSVADDETLDARINELETALGAESTALAAERRAYAELYTGLTESVTDWTDFVGTADDEALWAAMVEKVPALGEDGNAHLKDSFIALARRNAEKEQTADDEAQYQQLFSGFCGLVTDWEALGAAADDESLWTAMLDIMPSLAENEALKERLISDTRTQAAAVAEGTEAEEETEEISEESAAEVEVDYSAFVPSADMEGLTAASEAAYDGLWGELTALIPDLATLEGKMRDQIHEKIESIVDSSSLDFSERYSIYTAQKADSILTGGDAAKLKLASHAHQLLIASIALFLLAFTMMFWTPLTRRLGVPRTIITLFFLYLCLSIVLFEINLQMMLGNILIRMGMYGILVLAMLPGIQCGIGLNMGMTLGCISGLLGIVMALQFNMTGFGALIFACITGMVVAVPLGWAYSLLLNRMKGSEMTISTYVGFSFVSLMCIGWMMLPFNNPKIIWLLSGHGLRVTHSLLGSFAHLLDNLLSFKVFGIEVPTGVLLFFLLFCMLMWIFSRSKVGVAMSAAGSNPRFAEASGINVDSMRTLGTVLSTVLAAVGIVIYSQAFGYAQLYTAPRQLGFICASAILIGGATTSKARVSHVIIGVFLFEGVLVLGQQIANAAVAGGGLSEVMRILISNGIILYALTQSGGGVRD